MSTQTTLAVAGPTLAALPCTCCATIVGRPTTPAVARWTCPSSNVEYLCRSCLNFWLDNADDDEDLEPIAWSWLGGCGPE